ncbi:hypothetical protein, partial [Sinorhizobium meliloti]|uniref:hypothetical protein n=1 Tax=Rhizobium meliloti TaxID=382 RepID=UPI001AECE64F
MGQISGFDFTCPNDATGRTQKRKREPAANILPLVGRGIAYAEQAWNIEGFVLDAIPFCSPFDSSKSA